MASKEVELGDLKRSSTKTVKRRSTKTKTKTKKLKRRSKKKDSSESASTTKALDKALEQLEQGESLGDTLATEFDLHQQDILERIPTALEEEHKHVKEYGHMFKTLSRMARIAEKKYLDGQQSRDMYAALKAYDQMREIIADMKAMSDFTQFAEKIKTEVVDMVAQSSAAALIEYHKGVMSILQTNVDPNVMKLINVKLKSVAHEAGVKVNDARTSGFSVADELFVFNGGK